MNGRSLQSFWCFRFLEFVSDFLQYIFFCNINIIRCVFQIGCVVCLVIAIVILCRAKALYPAVTYSMIAVSVTFLFITFVDLWDLCIVKPIPWYAWAMVCGAAGLFFFLCCGLLIASISTITVWAILYAVVYGLTALVFIVDLLWLL